MLIAVTYLLEKKVLSIDQLFNKYCGFSYILKQN